MLYIPCNTPRFFFLLWFNNFQYKVLLTMLR